MNAVRKKRLLRILFSFFVLLLVIGISALAGVEIRKIFDRKEQLRIMADFEQRQQEYAEKSGMDHHYSGTAGEVYDSDFADGDTMAILTLDRLNIKVAISEGTDKDVLRVSAGHFNETDMPGAGNFAIAGHSSRIYTCLFNDMHNAVVGDVIHVKTKAGTRHYVVAELMVVEPDDVDVVEHTNESVLTIVTCTNDGAERLIIRGIETTIDT